MFDVACAGDFVIFNCQGDDSANSPVLILVRTTQGADVPSDVVAQYGSRPVCTSGAMLVRLLFPDFKEWQTYQDQVVGG